MKLKPHLIILISKFAMNFCKYFLVIVLSVLLVVSCKEKKSNDKGLKIDKELLDENLIQSNADAVLLENKLIDDWIKRRGIPFEETPTGLRYIISGKGTGECAKPGQKVTISYRVELLTGKLIYTSEYSANKVFVLGKSDVENGLEEGIMLMKQGQSAVLIIPYYLAHGILGDFNEIPPQNSIIYKLELIKIE